MNHRTVEELQYFVGKVCTIITTSMNRNFNELIAREHFAVLVTKITQDGIWGVHPYNHEILNFFNMQYIISIHEEYVIDPNNPEHKKLIEEYQKRTGKSIKPDLTGYPKTKENKPCCNQQGCQCEEKVNIDELENMCD